jgi:putative phage-type endonuclease
MLDSRYVRSFSSREDWLEARRTLGIGSSDVPAILGLSKYESPLSLYYLKTGAIQKPSARYEELARWGHILEPMIAQRFTEVTGRTLATAQQFTIHQNPKRPHAIASIDRFINGLCDSSEAWGPTRELPPGPMPAVLELKNVHFVVGERWSVENNNEPPVEYQVQVQHQLAVTELPWGSIAGLIGGSDFRWADLKRDDALIEKIEAAVDEFWFRVVKRDPPKADELEATSDVLRALYPKDTGKTITLPVEAFEWYGEWTAAKESVKTHAADVDKYKNLIAQAMGDATAGILLDGTVLTYKHQRREGFTVEPSEFRVLRKRGK